MMKGVALNDAYRQAVRISQGAKDDLLRDARSRLSRDRFSRAKSLTRIVEMADKSQLRLLALVIYAADVDIRPWALVDEEKLSVAARDAIRNELGL